MQFNALVDALVDVQGKLDSCVAVTQYVTTKGAAAGSELLQVALGGSHY